MVFPAQAGVIPESGKLTRLQEGIPRASGGDPGIDVCAP